MKTIARSDVLRETHDLVAGVSGISATVFGPKAKCLEQSPEGDPLSHSIVRKFSMLYDFALHGEWDDLGQLYRVGEITPECLAFVDMVDSFSDRGRLHFGLRHCEYIRHVALIANARLKLDEDFGDDTWVLTIPELALVTQLSESHLRNAAASEGPDRLPTFRRDGAVLVKGTRAQKWLKERGKALINRYSNSVEQVGPEPVFDWEGFEDALRDHAKKCGLDYKIIAHELGLDQEMPGCLTFDLKQWISAAELAQLDPFWLAGSALGFDIDKIQADFHELERRRDIVWQLSEHRKPKTEYIEVPVAKDGSIFNQKCKRQMGYQIGPKGKEIYVEDFFDALRRLKEMPAPYWRRPNVNGIPGIVVGTSWKQIAKEEIMR